MTTQYDIPAGSKVLVTGATGFTGSVLMRKLAKLDISVRAIARQSSNIEPFKHLDIEWIRGDVFDEQTVKQAMQGIEYVFHVAAAFREPKIADKKYHLVHVKSTELLANEAIKQENFKRFIHISTVGIHSHIENPPADENYPFQPDDIYQSTKAEGEKWIANFSKDNPLPLTIIRPCMIYGPEDARMFKLFRFVHKGWVPIVNHKNTLYHLIHVDDLTDFFIHCATAEQALGEIVICGNTHNTDLKSMTQYIAEELGTKYRFLNIPKKLFFIAGDICEFLCKKINVEPPIYRRRIAFFTKDRCFNVAKMQDHIGFTPKYDTENGVKMTTKWYVDKGWLTK